MKRKSVIIPLLSAFIVLLACTPSSLFRDSKKSEVAKADAVSLLADDVPLDSVKLSVPSSLELPVAVDDSTMQTLLQAIDSLAFKADSASLDVPQAVTDDSVSQLSVPKDFDTSVPAAAKMKRDTTTMDSLQLLIFKRNKAVDDSLALDSMNRTKKNGIDAPVKFSATDSLIYEAGPGMAHLFGDAHVEYQNMDLKSERIYMCLDSSLVHATGVVDSVTGQRTGNPVFKMGSDEYQNTEITFNFKTKKGLISEVYTQQEDGYLTSELSKRGANGELFLQHGRYTTCDEPHPDFYLALSRAKVRPGKDVVFGPAYLVVCDVPLPLAIPYGFFPFSKSYSSGFIMPTYGDETSRGFYLRDGGYYFAINDKMDLKLLGEIYTKGSWCLGSLELSQALQVQRLVLCQLPEFGDGREEYARLLEADQFQGSMEPQTGRQSQSVLNVVGQCQLCHVEL